MIKGLSERLKDLRCKYNYSQREVAKKINVSASIISAYETGERTPSVENLLALSYLYNCSLDYLVGKTLDEVQPSINCEHLSEEQIQSVNFLIKAFIDG